ncbi:hypothetical protein F2Q68_00019923 [Brassica cretica]|uniref:Uncharacterized protein n=2 Tax=Brassica cretica TaxID=69181 RepID=A0A8S9FT99_BRACR|nr:hypothetical protein F2Q68_00019923 [Brassica cretica]KAF3565823.1 hypothetical protein DY000_02013091 [Brassica cretica]
MDMNPMQGIASSIPTNIAEIPPTIWWSLFSKEGTPRLQGTAAIDTTHLPLVAEAMAMWSDKRSG